MNTPKLRCSYDALAPHDQGLRCTRAAAPGQDLCRGHLRSRARVPHEVKRWLHKSPEAKRRQEYEDTRYWEEPYAEPE